MVVNTTILSIKCDELFGVNCSLAGPPIISPVLTVYVSDFNARN